MIMQYDGLINKFNVWLSLRFNDQIAEHTTNQTKKVCPDKRGQGGDINGIIYPIL